MPYIKTRTNIDLTDEQISQIKAELGSAITLIGKTESWLMVDFDKNCDLYFKGDTLNPIAYVEVKLFGHADKSAYNSLTGAISSILNDKLGIDPSNIYVSYFETDNWGYNGSNF